jgi:hypothetical protein
VGGYGDRLDEGKLKDMTQEGYDTEINEDEEE